MNLKTYCLIFFVLLSSQLLIAQNRVFVDENLKEIDSSLFFKKCKSSYFYCLDFTTDSLEVSKIFQTYKFGKISSKNNKQLKNLIKNSDVNINSKSFIVIKYRDTVRDYESISKRNKRYWSTQKKYYNSKSKYYQNNKKCMKRYKKKVNLELYYAYNHNINFISKYESLNWIKDYNIIKNNFFKETRNGSIIILKPNGEYFQSSVRLSKRFLDKFLKTDDWSEYKLELNELMKNLARKNNLFLESMPSYSNFCF